MIGRGVATSAVIVPAIGVFLAHGMVIKVMTRDRVVRRKRLVGNVQRYSRFALKVMRVDVNLKATAPLPPQNYLMVSNHMSYLDMMVLACCFPAVFVTSVDMGQVFFLGQMAEIGGSLFIERRHRDRVQHDIQQIEEVLTQGFHVMLFPEGTSTDGLSVLPFKRSLLMAAAHADCPLLPITLKYRKVEGEEFSAKNHDVVCWYGKKDFVTHFIRLLSAKSIEAEVSVQKPMTFKTELEKHVVGDLLHQIISDDYLSQFKNLQGGSAYDGSSGREKSSPNISRGPRKDADFAEGP
ncbi:MAG: 1-acyl-sn-glycerol-3-phosphate acyltransferase [Bdellovibrionales bacterium]|nr:1-acyl-sn-glycerol-3-phosphate acyltransferase [Bdellovibrionales bacterium]